MGCHTSPAPRQGEQVTGFPTAELASFCLVSGIVGKHQQTVFPVSWISQLEILLQLPVSKSLWESP